MTILTQITAGQLAKEATANGNFAAVSPSAMFSQKIATTTGLTWGYFGGQIYVDGTLTSLADGTLALTASATNFIEITRAGTLASNTSAFTAGRIPLYDVVTGASAITTITDRRILPYSFPGKPAAIAITTADVTASAIQARNQFIEVSGALTAARSLILPLQVGLYQIFNNTTGAFTLTIKGATGTGVIVGQKYRVLVMCDGTNFQQVQTDPQGQDIAYAATITPDASIGEVVNVGALTAGITVNAPTNPTKYGRLVFMFVQGGAGAFAITWNAAFKKAADPGAGATGTKAVTEYLYDGANWIQQGGALAWF